MSVLATPAVQPRAPMCGPSQVDANLTPVACAGQYVLSTQAATARGRPVLTRTRAINVAGGQKAVFRWQMHDRDGSPVDMRECLCLGDGSVSSSSVISVSSSVSVSSEPACDYKLKFRMLEYIMLTAGGQHIIYSADPVAITPEAGIFEVTIDPAATRIPGVYFGEMALVGTDDDDCEYVVFSNTFYLYVNRGAWSRKGWKGPPTIAEVRLHLRDSSREESYLLDHVRFDDAEIAHAAELCVEQWNELPPPIDVFTTRNFPFRYHWLSGICGHLFRIAAEQYRANNLKYSAAGLSIDDQDKEPNYERAALARLQEWVTFIRTKKVSLNIGMAYAELGSPYDGMG